MSWGSPAYLWLLLWALPLAALALRSQRRRVRDLAALAGSDAAATPPLRPGWPAGASLLWSAAALLLVLALCAPQWGVVAQERRTRGVDILVALDTSRSMLADDLGPSRLAAAKEAAAALAAGLQGDRIGLIAFAGSAFLVCPLSNDYGAFNAALAETGVDSIPLGGSSLAAPLDEARGAFAGGTGEGRVLIVISDGEDHGSGYAAAARLLKESGVKVYTVAAGTSRGGLIPLRQGEFLRDRDGLLVRSRPDREALHRIAAAGGGRLLELSAGRVDLAQLYRGELTSLQQETFRSSRPRLRERFQLPLALALLLLAAEPCLGLRGRR